MDTTGTPEDGGAKSWGEPAGGEYGYDTGYGYGPGYSGPVGAVGGAGGGFGYGSPAPATDHGAAAFSSQQATAPLRGSPPRPAQLPPVVGPTPALRGLPGGPGIEPETGEPAPPGPAADRSRQAGGSLWQRSQGIWSDRGIIWQRPVTNTEPAEAEWERIQSASAPPRRQRRKADGGRSATGGPEAVAEPAAPGRAFGPVPRRGITRRTIVVGAAVVLAIAVLAAAGYLIRSGAAGGHQKAAAKPRHQLPVSPYPPAALAGADFTNPPGLATRGVFQSLSAVASYGSTVVAAGSQTGTDIARTQFFVSTDAGRTWQLAPALGANGSEPPATRPPAAIVAGPAGWLAIGPGASWTSSTGRSWQLATAAAIPLEPGDQVLAVTATAHGFLAAGSAAPHGLATPVVWTSPDGRTWQRAAAQLPLHTPGGAVGAIDGAASHGDSTIVAAQVTTTVRTGTGAKQRIQRSTSIGLWQSRDGGVTWSQAPVPVSNGAVNAVSGIAPSAAGFVLVRPGGTAASGPEGVIYSSATGGNWTYAGTITAGRKAALRLLTIGGGDHGAVIGTMMAGGNLVAYRNVSGQSWQPAAVLANAGTTTLSGLTLLPGGGVVAAGVTAVPAGSQGFLEVASAGRTVVNLAKIPGAWFPQRSVNAIAATPGLDVAAGSAGGQPAVWAAAGGHAWSAAAGANAAVFGRTGLAALTSVAAGSSGWLAVGGPHPVVVFSPDGRTWRAADGDPAFGQAGAITSAAAARGSRYVVVGARTTGGRTIAAAWWSSGLGKWNRATDARSGALEGRAGTRRMVAVTAGPFGFVAIGQRNGLPVAWTSADGSAWRLVAMPAVGAGSLSYVTSAGNTVVAAGTAPRPAGTVPLVAVSTDGGLTWSEATVAVPADFTRLTGLTSAGRGFVAVGTLGAPSESDVVVLTSPDGTTWQPVAPSGTGLSGPGAQQITALTTAGGRLLGAGFTATARSEDPTLWIAPPAPATITPAATAKASPPSS